MKIRLPPFAVLLACVLIFLTEKPCLGGGWYVGNTAAGEWIQYQSVYLTAGSYRFTAHAASPAGGAALHLEIDGVTVKPTVAVPNTGRADSFGDVHLGSASLAQGYHNLRVVFETSGVSLDWFMLRKDTDTSTVVKASDTTMVRPPTSGMLISPVVAFGNQTSANSLFTANDTSSVLDNPESDTHSNPYSDAQMGSWYRAPMYRDFDRRTDRFWDIMVDQLVASRAQVPFLHCRATADFTDDLQDRAYQVGGGDYEGRWLKKFSEAVARNPQAATSLQIGMFWESSLIANGYFQTYASNPAWGDAAFADYCMQYWLQPWFDNVPAQLLYQAIPSRPIISVFANRPVGIVSDGKMGVFLANIRSRMIARYGLNPIFILPIGGDVDAAAQAQAWGQASWVTWDGPLLTLNPFGGSNWGTTSAGSRRRLDTVWLNDWNPSTNTGTPGGDSPGHDSYQSPLAANGDSVLLNDLNQAQSLGARLVQEEGFYNISEGNAVFRSYAPGWAFPNQHLAALRQYADVNTDSLIFEAEGCDSYFKTTIHENLGGSYRRHWYSFTGLDVYRPLHNLDPWVAKSAGPGNLSQISAGFFDVWALDVNGQVWAQPISGTPNTWVGVSMDGVPKFNCLSVGKHFAWAINGTAVYCCKLPYGWPNNGHTTWTLQSGNMIQLSVGDAEVWAVDAAGAIYRRPVNAVNVTTNSWTLVAGPSLSKIATGGAFVWGMSGTNIYYSPTAAISWTQVANPYNITQISVGSEEVWGVNAAGNVYRMSAAGVGGWDLVDGNLTQISVGENYALGLSGPNPFSRKLEGFMGSAAPTAPPAPGGLTASAGNTQVLLNWTASPGATCYNVKRSTVSGGPYTTIATGVYVSTQYADTGLTNGTTYYYLVSAANGVGETLASQVSAVPAATAVPPVAPAALTATAGIHQISLSWPASSGATSYSVQRAVQFSGGPYTTIAAGVTGTSYVDTGLIGGRSYYYVVSASNAAGQSYTVSPEASAAPSDAPLSRVGWVASASVGGSPVNAIDGNSATRWTTGTPQAPGQWFQVDMGASQTFLKVTLDQATSANDYPRGYQLYVSNDGVNWGNPVATGVGTVSMTTITFSQQTARYIRITQTGSAGNYWSIHEINVYVGPTASPTGMSATAMTANQINLSWAAIAGATSYNLKRSLVSGGPYATVATGITSTSYADTGLAASTSYYYVVTAVSGAGESASSGEASATTLNAILGSWYQTYFGGSTTNRGLTQSFTNDGIANLLKFAFGMNPTVPGGPALRYSGTFAGGGTIAANGMPITAANGVNYLVLFVRRTDYVNAGLIYTPLFSADLSYWQTSTDTPTVLSDNGTYQVVSLPYPLSINGKKGRFFKMQVSTGP